MIELLRKLVCMVYLSQKDAQEIAEMTSLATASIRNVACSEFRDNPSTDSDWFRPAFR